MQIKRRDLLAAAPLAFAAAGVPIHPARASGDDLAVQMADRSLGRADAPVTVTEWFSLTCPHCARFSQTVMPQIKAA